MSELTKATLDALIEANCSEAFRGNALALRDALLADSPEVDDPDCIHGVTYARGPYPFRFCPDCGTKLEGLRHE